MPQNLKGCIGEAQYPGGRRRVPLPLGLMHNDCAGLYSTYGPPSRSLSLEAIRASLNIDCPHCHATLGPADWQMIDRERKRCLKCGQEFVPKPEEPIRTGWSNSIDR